MGSHTVQPNCGCALGAIHRSVVQRLALVAVDIWLQEIADGCDGQELTATTMRLCVDCDCSASGLCTHPVHHKPQILAHDRAGKCYITPAFSGIPKQKGTSAELAASPLPSRGPERGRKCYITTHSRGSPKKGGKNQNWLPHPCLLGGPKEGENATSPLHSRGSQTKETKSKHKKKQQKNLKMFRLLCR